MATAAELPVNGSYAQQGYDGSNYANNAPSYSASASQPAQSSNTAASEIPKDEVGWYFVEQYYTTLSRSPDKLYLFYNKRSQFVSGNEEDKVNVCVGQKAINDRIKDLDFHDTKVRVTNVDSQGSDANIVIQVIGEISNKGHPHKRFAQTFVLAEQTNGYFVLNDIFRYLAEEPEDEEDIQHDASAPAAGVQEPAPTAAAPENAGLNQSDEIATTEEDLNKVDQKLETAKEEPAQEAPATATNGTPAAEEVAEAEDAPAAAVSASEEAPSKEPEAAVEVEVAQPEKPKDPAPTPAPKAAAPAAPAKPAVPKSWAALAASAHKVATPVMPAAATSQAPSQAKSTTSTPAPQAAPEKTPAPARESSPTNSQGDAAGWQSVGTKKEQSRGQQAQAPQEADQRRAYIKNVYSQVEEGALKAALTKFGEIEHLDISRQKNCAFVDFKTAAAFQAAVNANPHTVNGLEIKVEERKLRPQQGFNTNFRGGPGGRGRGFPGQSRGGFQRGGRGGSVRGRGGAPQES
ncbi:hypothetical protein DPSP01_012391 [Paraphaeosphaeria sporulosa]|uniref:NTF2-domain-containing protein n=1 Tax=Paraphaeosphaeria sporulosa TaxID=1460663 RepID=A0A177CU43_9PLEO|nr:uncharacterized protein CC84DRAFT_478030 [Paraphaeosphaeria sporulosa]OAG10297.1 hypothetical protein CC84DRAFT_478030 [Paraphaeosphaeria sporulosa]